MRYPILRPFCKLFILLGCLSLVGCGFVASSAEQPVPEYVFTYAENQSADHPSAQAALYFSQLVEERTDGRIVIHVYTDAAFGDEPAMIDQAQFGGMDFIRVSAMSLADEIPLLNLLQLPYLYENSGHMWRVLDSELGQVFFDSLTENKLVGLSWFDAGSRHFYGRNTPIQTLEDFSGLRIRVAQSTLMEDMIRCLGAVPVPADFEEVYSMLETGAIDGAENNWLSFVSKSHDQVSDYMILDAHSQIPELQICSKSTWDLLSPENQQIILECSRESARYQHELWQQSQQPSGHSVQILTFSEEEQQRLRQAVQPLYDKYTADYQEILQQIQSMADPQH